MPTYDLDYFPKGGLRANFVETGKGPLTTIEAATWTRTLDQIGSFTFTMPATDPLAAQIADGVHINVYHRKLGSLGQFVVRDRRLSPAQTSLQVSCWSLLQELVFYNTFLNRQYSNIAVSTVLSTLNVSGNLNGLLNGTGWTQGSTDAGLGNITVQFQGQSVFAAIDTVAKQLKKHFREGTAQRTLDFGAMGADTGIRLVGAHSMNTSLASNAIAGIIETIDQSNDPDEIINTILPLGGGQGVSTLTLQQSTRTSPYTVQTGTNPDGSTYYYIADATSQTTYGTRWKTLPFTHIAPLANSTADIQNAADALYDATNAVLQWYKDEHISYTCVARQVPASLREGDKARVFYRGVVTRNGTPFKWIDIDGYFFVMQRVDNFAQNGDVKTTLALSNLGRVKQNDTAIVVGALQAVQSQQLMVQPYPSQELFTYREEISSANSVTLPVDIDNSVLYLNRATLRLQTRPLRSTVQTLSAASAATITSSASGIDTYTSSASGAEQVTSVGGGSQTPTSSASGAEQITSTASGAEQVTSNASYSPHQHIFPNIFYTGTPGSTMGYAIGSGSYNDALLVSNASFSGVRTADDIVSNSNPPVANPIHNHLVTPKSHQHTVTPLSHQHTVSISSHTHTVTPLSHQHSITSSSHAHTVNSASHNHSLNYGIFDDTQYPNTISMAVDGVDSGSTWGVGGGAVNTVITITNLLNNSALGLRALHTLTFTCASGQGQIVASINIRTTTQAINLS